MVFYDAAFRFDPRIRQVLTFRDLFCLPYISFPRRCNTWLEIFLLQSIFHRLFPDFFFHLDFLFVHLLRLARITWVARVYSHRRTGDLGIFEFWDFPFEFQVRQQFKSDGNIINQRASEGFREPHIASKGLRGPQRSSEGLTGSPGAYLFLVSFISSSFFHFFPTGFESDTILSPTPRDFPGSPGSPFSYADVFKIIYHI